MTKKNFDSFATRFLAAPGAAGVSPAKLDTPSSTVDARERAVHETQARGGLLEPANLSNYSANRYTAEAAMDMKLPLRTFKIPDLVVHPYNVRPESGKMDLADLTSKLALEGQLDPIHVVPYQGGHAIMEGQRRWLAAPAAGITTLTAWVHPEPTDPFEVYAFGQMIHESRKDSTPFDQAVVWSRMLNDKVFLSPADLARRLQIDDSTISSRLKIIQVGKPVLDEIRNAPMRFSHRHLYAIAQINEHAGQEIAAQLAHSVSTAAIDNPVSARKLEALASAYVDTGNGPARGRRKNSVPLTIRSSNGKVMGAIKSYKDGRLEFKPTEPLPEELSERIAQVVRSVFATELQPHFESTPSEKEKEFK